MNGTGPLAAEAWARGSGRLSIPRVRFFDPFDHQSENKKLYQSKRIFSSIQTGTSVRNRSFLSGQFSGSRFSASFLISPHIRYRPIVGLRSNLYSSAIFYVCLLSSRDCVFGDRYQNNLRPPLPGPDVYIFYIAMRAETGPRIPCVSRMCSASSLLIPLSIIS